MVRQTTADLLFADEAPLAMKLDVEGYEAAVLTGAPATLANPGLKALIVALNGSGPRYGFNDKESHRNLLRCWFTAYNYDPKCRLLSPQDGTSSQNTIYVRDPDWGQSRLRTARTFTVFNGEVG